MVGDADWGGGSRLIDGRLRAPKSDPAIVPKGGLGTEEGEEDAANEVAAPGGGSFISVLTGLPLRSTHTTVW